MKLQKLVMQEKEDEIRKEKEKIEEELKNSLIVKEQKEQKKKDISSKYNDLKRYISEANECAKLMKKDIKF